MVLVVMMVGLVVAVAFRYYKYVPFPHKPSLVAVPSAALIVPFVVVVAAAAAAAPFPYQS